MRDIMNKLENRYIEETNDYVAHSFIDINFGEKDYSKKKEKTYVEIHQMDLAESKRRFSKLSVTEKIECIRYILSRRLLDSEILSYIERDEIKKNYESAVGSLCAMDEEGTRTVALESHLITRLLYITEELTTDEFRYIEKVLLPLHDDYKVLMQVIESRLSFHNRLKVVLD